MAFCFLRGQSGTPSSVTLVNQLNATVNATVTDQQVGYSSKSKTIVTFNTIAGHRYFIRAMWNGYSFDYGQGGYYYNGYVSANGVNIAGRNTQSQFAQTSQTGQIITTAGGNSFSAYVTMTNYQQSQGSATGTVYMVVDITEFEELKGRTYTADEFWQEIGSAVFYGTKEIEV